jgi:hypothetical protein
MAKPLLPAIVEEHGTKADLSTTMTRLMEDAIGKVLGL